MLHFFELSNYQKCLTIQASKPNSHGAFSANHYFAKEEPKMSAKHSLTKTLPRESGNSTSERKPSQHCVLGGYSLTTPFIEEPAGWANHSMPPWEMWRPVEEVKISQCNWRRDDTPSAKPSKLSADVAGMKHEKMVRMSVHHPETLDRELGRATQQKEELLTAENESPPMGRQFIKSVETPYNIGTSESETVDSEGDHLFAWHHHEEETNEKVTTSDVITPWQEWSKEKQWNPGSLANILEEETDFLISPEWKIYEKAMLICKYQEMNSPKKNRRLYNMARAIVVETLEDLGTEDPHEGSNGFYSLC